MQQTSPENISPLNSNNPYDGITKSHSSHMVKGRVGAIGGMGVEENPEQLRGKQAMWHKDVKDHVH